MAFESGVTSYVVGQYTVSVPFPVDKRGNPHIRCEMCEFFSHSSSRCRLNGKICEFPNKYVGSFCPLEFEKSNDDKGENEYEFDNF